MPFIVCGGPATSDKPIEALLCEATGLGTPNGKMSVPVLVRLVDETKILIEPNDLRELVSTLHREYAVGPGRRDIAASVRRARLQKASELSEQLRRLLSALEPAENVLGHMTEISDWIKQQQSDKP